VLTAYSLNRDRSKKQRPHDLLFCAIRNVYCGAYVESTSVETEPGLPAVDLRSRESEVAQRRDCRIAVFTAIFAAGSAPESTACTRHFPTSGARRRQIERRLRPLSNTRDDVTQRSKSCG